MKPKNQTFAYKIALFRIIFQNLLFFFNYNRTRNQDKRKHKRKRLISKWRGTKRAGLEKRGVEGWLNPGLGGGFWDGFFLLSFPWTGGGGF